MKLLNLIRRLRGQPEQRSWSHLGYDGAVHLLQNYGTVDSGVAVTPETAMTCSSVFACISKIARDISTLPAQVIDRQNSKRVPDHPVARLLRNPNEQMTAPSFWASYMMNLLLYGNAYAYIERASDPVALWPIKARDALPHRVDSILSYRVSGLPQLLRPDEVAHCPYLPLDGIVGISPIGAGAQTIGTSLALEKFAALYFKNGANVGVCFEISENMSKQTVQETRELLLEQYTGLDNAHEIIAAPGLKPHRIGNNLKDSQGIEMREWQLRDVARIYNMPIGLLDAEKSTYGNLEAQDRDYAKSTLRPWVVLIEQEFARKLFSEDEQDQYKIEFNLDAFVRSSIADRAAADTKLFNAGIITANEARVHHNYPPLPGGDQLLSPLNMAPAAQRAAQPVYLDAINRLVTKETNAITRAAKKHIDADEFCDAVEDFYQRHEALVHRSLTPAHQVSFQTTGTAQLNYATDHCQRHLDEVLEAHRTGTLDQLIEEWRSNRAEQIADELTGEENYERTTAA